MYNGEKERLQVLQSYNILDTEPEEAFDNLAKLAAQIAGTEGAQINFIDKDRQWSKANIGWGKPEVPRKMGFCTHTIKKRNSLMVIRDAQNDRKFKNNPLSRGDPPLRFYAGVSIKSENAIPLGVLCVFDSEPKDLTDQQLNSLKILAREVETHLKLRVTHDQLTEQLARENKLNRKIIDTLPINFFMYNAEGELVLWNENIINTTGYSEEEIKKMHPVDYFHEKDHEFILKKMEETLEGNQVAFEANIITKQGVQLPFIFSSTSFHMNNETFLIGTAQDISDQKKTQTELEQSNKEKDLLLAEVHHRVKNNLAIISAMMQMETLLDEEALHNHKFMNTVLRINAMAEVHEIMYKVDNLTHVSFSKVLPALVENIKKACADSGNINISYDAEDIILNVNQAIPCGMIINDLLLDVYKQSNSKIPNSEIFVKMQENRGSVNVRIGLQNHSLLVYNIDEAKVSIANHIFDQLCAQLNADVTICSEPDTVYSFQFDKKELKGGSSAIRSLES